VVVGQPALIARLLVWALAIVAVDGVVIATSDGAHKPATRTAQAVATTTTTTSREATTATVVAAESTTSVSATTPTTVTTTSRTGSGEVVVAHLQGDGETSQSAGFHVEGHWQLRWRVDQGGNGVAATVDDDDTGTQKLFAGLTPGEGSSDVPTGCNCTLHLTPDGSAYDVLVVDVEG
jgi:hypothetical protein